jgi:hypothetical protein
VALSPGDQHFLFTMANALTVSMCGFIVGGSFIAGMLNDLTWLTFALVAALDRLSARMIRDAEQAASQAQQTWWFPQRINNAVLLWAVANGAIGLGLFYLSYRFHGSRNGVSPEMLGLRTNTREFLKTCALALCILAAFYALLFVSYALFHVDFRFFFISAAASFPPRMGLVALEYIPLFFVFYPY